MASRRLGSLAQSAANGSSRTTSSDTCAYIPERNRLNVASATAGNNQHNACSVLIIVARPAAKV